MSETNIVRRRERSGTETQAKSSVLMDAELGVITDVKKLVVGDGNKKGGYTLTPDNVVAVWPDQTDAGSPLSLAWWIKRAGGAETKLRLTAGAYNIQDDLTVPSNIYLDIDKGAVINIASGKTLTLNCEIGADVQPVFSGGGAVTENYIRRLVVNENLISHKRHLWHEGKRDEKTGAILSDPTIRRYVLYSDFFEIKPSVTYTIKAWADSCFASLLFFSQDKEYISHYWPQQTDEQKGYSFIAPENTAYISINSYLPNKEDPGHYLRTSIRELGWKHLYKLEKGVVATAFSTAYRDLQEPDYIAPDDRPKNNPEAARQLVSCAESYKHPSRWTYSSNLHVNDQNTVEGPPYEDLFETVGGERKARIDCMTIMQLALNGIPYFQSKYFNESFSWRGTAAACYSWGKYAKWNYFADFARWCYHNGWEIHPGINYDNLQAGDLIFWGGNPASPVYEDFAIGGFRAITHVGMYTGRWVRDPDRNDELHPQTIEVQMESPVVVNRFVDRSVEYIQMFARVPLETAFTEYDSAFNTDNVIYSSYYKPSVYAVGNGKPLKIDIYGRNYAVWTLGGVRAETGLFYETKDRIRSNYIPYACTYKNKDLLEQNGFVSPAWHFYDADLCWLGTTDPGSSAKYSVITFKKTDGSEITAADLKKFNKMTAVQKTGRDTITNGKYSQGFYTCAHIETIIPSGAYLDRRNGRYAYTEDGLTWTELPESDQAKLNALRIGDGENNVYVPNAQHVKLMRQAMDY